MNILLLNNNPVVKKLVTLSVQKTSDELHTAESVETIESGDYDLFIIDDALYSDEAMDEIASKISYSESLFICSKDAQEQAEFTKTLKKPFLPTDLVETLISLAKMVDTVELEKMDGIGENDFDAVDDALFHDFETDDSLDELDDLDALVEMEDLDMLEASDEEAYNNAALEDVKEEGVLDRDELQEVQSLLEETETEGFDDFDFDAIEEGKEEDDLDLNFDDALEVEDVQTPKEELIEELDDTIDEDAFSFEEEETKEAEPEQEDELLGHEEETDEDGMLDFEEELPEEVEPQEQVEAQEEVEEALEEDSFETENLDEEVEEEAAAEEEEEEPQEELEEEAEEELEEEDLASQIQEAVASLSDEDLQREVDEDILLSIGSLTSKDLKLAIGEDVQEEQPELCDAKTSQDVTLEKVDEQSSLEQTSHNGNGVEALKKLLKALSNEDVAASLQGMKININITLGDA